MPCSDGNDYIDRAIDAARRAHAEARQRRGLEESPDLPYEVLDGQVTVAAFKHKRDARRFTENSDLRIVRCPPLRLPSDEMPSASESRPIHQPVLARPFDPQRNILSGRKLDSKTPKRIRRKRSGLD